MTKELNVKQFRDDVADHGLEVRSDNGLYRHLHFRGPAPNAWNMWFEVVTWPGSLAINGDMGSWSFSRVDDMFNFFRSSELKINASYWCEKIQSESRFGGPSMKFTAGGYKANVLSALEQYGLCDTQKADLIDALEAEVFGEEDESTARRALADFAHGDFTFSESWEIGGKGYTYHFLWCLHAIVWAIQQYDAVHASALSETPEGPALAPTESSNLPGGLQVNPGKGAGGL